MAIWESAGHAAIPAGRLESAILQNTDSFIAVIDAELHVIYCNPGAYRMSGYTPEEVGLDLGPRRIYDDETSARIIDALRYAVRHGHWQGEAEMIRRDGTRLPVEQQLFSIRDGEKIYVGTIMRDVSKIKEAQRELLRAKEQAEEANRAKSQFLSNMSHEIRTPMNAIIGMTKIAKATDEIGKIRSCLTHVETSSNHLLNIINDVLDLSKVESGRFELYDESFDLEQVLQDLVHVISIKAEEKRQDLFVRIENNVPRRLLGDSVRFTQVIMNLISNAIKFTPVEGRVELHVRIRERARASVVLEVIVSDTGIGMSEKQMQGLFQAFSQADGSITKRYGGTGLGLAISQKIVTIMGGDIQVDSEVGVGSRFSFAVPFKIVDDTELVQVSVPPSSVKTLRVLVVDDSEEICQYMRSILESHSIRCDTVQSGFDALTQVDEGLAARDPFNVIFMDLRMDGMDGLETARRLREKKDFNASIVMISMYELHEIEREAREAGIRKLLSKPLFPSTIITTINEIIGAGVPRRDRKIERQYVFPGKKILLVEDMEINRVILKSLLEPTRVEVFEAEDGAQAVELIESNAYDLILMDVQMPHMDGYTATGLIRSSPRGRDVPIVAMTANAFKEDIDRALASGMNGHLSKPIDEAKMFVELSRYLRTEEEEEGALPEEIWGVNLAQGLKILAGNVKLYTRLLESFSQKTMLEDLLAAVDTRDPAEVSSKAHALTGVAANLCLEQVLEQVKLIELRAKGGEAIEPEDDQLAAFRQDYARTMRTIRRLIQEPSLIEAAKQ